MSSVEEKKIILDTNLTKNEDEVEAVLEKRVAHIAEKSRSVMQLYGKDTSNSYEEIFSLPQRQDNCIGENQKYVSSVINSVNIFDRLNWVDSFFQKDGMTITEGNTEEDFDSNTVVYLKNPLADIAYNNFSKLLQDPRVLYKETFSDVCEEVYYSRVPYCILPIDNSEEGRMTSFGNMIRKYGLKIILTCNVESANGKITRFALLKRELEKIECKKAYSEGEYLEVGFYFGEGQKLQEVLTAAMFFGFSLNKVDSLPIYYSEKEYYFNVVFQGNGQIEKFLYWLELEIPRYEIIGIYTQVKSIRSKRGG